MDILSENWQHSIWNVLQWLQCWSLIQPTWGPSVVTLHSTRRCGSPCALNVNHTNPVSLAVCLRGSPMKALFPRCLTPTVMRNPPSFFRYVGTLHGRKEKGHTNWRLDFRMSYSSAVHIYLSVTKEAMWCRHNLTLALSKINRFVCFVSKPRPTLSFTVKIEEVVSLFANVTI